MEAEWVRYNCQMALPGFSEAAQRKLQNAKVLIVGAGGLGCPAALYLASSGIGTLAIADYDTISTSNLHRQVLFTPEDVGLKKALLACDKLRKQNPATRLIPIDAKVTSDNVLELVKEYDVVVDATDNFETKYLLNDACVLIGKPLVYGAVFQYEAQVSVFNTVNADGSLSANYRDLFPEATSAHIPGCSEAGVLPTVTGIAGCIQANEVIKLITGTGELLTGRLMIFDALSMQSRTIKTAKVTKTTITSIVETAATPQISVSELKGGMDKNLYDLVDVRRTEEHQVFNIGGINIPLAELEHNTFEWTTNKPLVLYCASGKRSAEAVRIMKEKLPALGVFSLEGGLKAWKETY